MSPTPEAPQKTWIDRRKCHRTVEMKVLVLGLCRTGTASIQQALSELGYKGVYHMRSIKDENPPDALMWEEALKRKAEGGQPFGRKEWDQLLGHCESLPFFVFKAVTDVPPAYFAADLIAAYPEAKVILSIRDPESWHKSVSETLMTYFHPLSRLEFSFLCLFSNALALPHRMNTRLVIQMFDGDFEGNWRKVYDEHNDTVRRITPTENLPVFNPKDGWEPFAEFLEKDAPPGEKFPYINGSQTWQRKQKQRKADAWGMAMRKMGVCAAVCVVGFGAYLGLRR